MSPTDSSCVPAPVPAPPAPAPPVLPPLPEPVPAPSASASAPGAPSAAPSSASASASVRQVKVVKPCVWGSTDAFVAGCPVANEWPGGGTCYKKPLAASMIKHIDGSLRDTDTATRCFNDLTQKGTSLKDTAGQHTYEQALAACEAQGPGWRLPASVDEAGKTCGTGHGLDANFMWTSLS